MIDNILDKYLEDLQALRENEAAFERYKFKLSEDKKRDENQINRLRIGIGLLNDLKIPEDYDLVKKLIEQEVRRKTTNTKNDTYDVLYLYYYLLSEFKVIEDIWDYAALKFDGTMDADMGFETGFFSTYGKENLRLLLQNSSHRLKDKIYNKIFYEETAYSDQDGAAYKEQQLAYFGLKRPLKNVPGKYMWIQEKEGFREALNEWISNTDLSDGWNAGDYVTYAAYLGDETEIETAMKNYLKVSPKSWSATQYKRALRTKRIKKVLQKVSSWFQWKT